MVDASLFYTSKTMELSIEIDLNNNNLYDYRKNL